MIADDAKLPGHRRLRVFISSTADLKKERDIVELALSELEVDGIRFESWPASPNSAVAECLQQIKESDAITLILGPRYGSLTQEGISVTRLEFRKAKEWDKPVFALIMDFPHWEPDQERFVAEVREYCWAPIVSLSELGCKVRASFIQEFTRCFRQVHANPPETPPTVKEVAREKPTPLSHDPQKALAQLTDLYEQGEDLTIRQISAEAEARFGQVIEIMNLVYMAEVNYGMGGGAVSREMLIKALTFWESGAARERWTSFSLLFNQGNALGVLQRLHEAIEKYRQALKANPGYVECWKNLGSAYLRVGDVIEAEQCYLNAVKMEPLLFEGWYCLASLNLRHRHNPEIALSYLNRIITSLLPAARRAAVYGWKAVAYQAMGRFFEGVVQAEEALTQDAEANWVWILAGRLYALAWRQDKIWLRPASAFWERFLNKFPDIPDAWAELGYIHFSLKESLCSFEDKEKSMNALNRAIDLGFEDDGLAWDRLGHLYQEQENWHAAENAYRQAALKNPSEFGFCLGIALLQSEKYPEALPWLKEAAEKHHPDALSWFWLAFCLEKLGRPTEAIAAYEKTIALDPDYPEAFYNLGGLYWNERLIPQAKTIWREAISRFPDHTVCSQVKLFLQGCQDDDNSDSL